MAADFRCPVIALTIDDHGMAKTIERKMELARRLRGLACNEFGLPEEFLYIDPLVFTLATGNPGDAGAAAVSLDALRRIRKEMPGVRTVMGVSNVSYGLSPAARRVLNNVMLHHATASGLDAAIFNPLHRDDIGGYAPEVRTAAEDLLLNRAPDALQAYIRQFEGKEKERVAASSAGGSSSATKEKTPAEALRSAILDRDPRGVPSALEALLLEMPAAAILDTILLPGMDDVGKRMATGDMILPFVLQAAG